MIERRRMLMAGKKSRIPSAYQEVEYLAYGSGVCYIDTGFKPSNNTILDVKFDYTPAPDPNNDHEVLGVRGTLAYDLELNYDGIFYYQGGGRSAYTSPTYRLTDGGVYEFEVNKNKLIELSTGIVYKEYTNFMQYQGLYNLFLFGMSRSGVFERQWYGKIYYCKIWENNGILSRDFVPCYRKSDNVAGMYDLINDVFYVNAGTGTFSVGPNVNALNKIVKI